MVIKRKTKPKQCMHITTHIHTCLCCKARQVLGSTQGWVQESFPMAFKIHGGRRMALSSHDLLKDRVLQMLRRLCLSEDTYILPP